MDCNGCIRKVVVTVAVKQHKNGKWYAKFTIKGVTKHLLCPGATGQKQAEEMEDAFKYKLQQQMNGVIPKEQKNIYFRRLKELYTRHAKNNHKKHQVKKYYLDKLEEYFNNGKPVNDIKPKDIETFKTYLRETRHLKNSSINRYLEILSKMFNLAIVNGELSENPVSKSGFLKEDNHTIRFLTSEEEQRLFKSIDSVAPYLRPIVTIALQTGMRRGEILNLQWSDIKNGYIELLETKSGKMRNIPISSTLSDVLATIPPKSSYVFANPKTNKPYTDIKKSWKNVLDDAEISNFRFHDLRHTVATRMVEKGIDLLVVKDILGHARIETTLRYAHPVPERKQAAIDVLNNY